MQTINQCKSILRFCANNLIILVGSLLILSGATVLVNDIAFPTAAMACHCDVLESTKVSDTTYQFNANIVVSGGVKLSKVVYDFGDGSTDTETSASKLITHVFKKAGAYTVKATAYFDNESSSSTAGCTTTIVIPQPPVYACAELSSMVLDVASNKYQFSAEATSANGAILNDAAFDFGDGQTASGIKPTSTNSVTVTHQYATPGTYSIMATLSFGVDNVVKNATCSTVITITESPTYTCTSLTAIEDTAAQGLFHIQAQASSTSGAILTNAAFDYGDGVIAANIQPSSTNKITIDHTYTKSGNYTVKATLNFNIAGSVKSAACATNISFTPQVPHQLPSTGPSDLFGSAFGLSTIVGAGTNYIRSRWLAKVKHI